MQRRHNEHENNEINRLDKLGNTSRRCRRRATDVPTLGTTNDGDGCMMSPAEVKIIVDGPRTRCG